MCTNYVPTRGERLQAFFDATPPSVSMREQAYPGYLAPILRPASGSDGNAAEDECVAACFGLIPSWSRDGKNFRFCYNARSETVADKPSFRHAWRQGQRCVIPADAFFEPNYESGRPVRWRISAADDTPMALAGIWEAWRKPPATVDGASSARQRIGPPEMDLIEQDWLISFSMLTINADTHPVMRQFHAPGDEKRSVVMLEPNEVQQWLFGPPEQAVDMLHAYDAERLIARPDPAPRTKKPSQKQTPAIPVAQRKLL